MNIFISCRKFREVLKKEGISFVLLKTKSYLLYLSKKRFSKIEDKKELKVEDSAGSSIEKSSAQLIESKNFGSGTLKLFLGQGKAKLYWSQVELTKQFGMHSAFKAAGKWYDSSQAQWSVKGINEDKLHISLSYQDLPIEKSWLINFIRPDELSWEVEMRIKQPLFIQNRKVGLFLSDNYTRWFNSCEEGQFPEGFNWENIFLNQIESRKFGVKPEEAGGVRYPGISFEVKNEGLPLLQNTNEELSSRAVQFELKDSVQDGHYLPGTYKWCLASVKLIEDENIIDAYVEDSKKRILEVKIFGNDNLKLFFDNGKASLYWNDLELTKHFGLHAALKLDNQWYDSSCAHWELKKINPEKLSISLYYKDIPVVQNWLFNFIRPDELSWEVEMRIKQPLFIQNRKVGLFLSDNYTRWFNSCEEGQFPEGFNWENIFLNQIESRKFGVKPEEAGGVRYPGISFEVKNEGLPLLQNTNEELSSRAVQFELKDSVQDGHYLPGTYKWCLASVKLIEDENIIDAYVEDSKLLPLDKQTFYIFGDSRELHDRIAGKKDDFQETTFKIKKILSENKRINIKIGVSKYNFYRLKEIVDFSASLLRQNVDLSGISLCLFPVNKLYFSFVSYVEEIKARINTEEIKLVLFDETLFDLLGNIANQSNPYNERRLLRMLGVISEHAFIGPQTVVIDPHHRCNCNCLHCWVHMPGIKHTREFLNRKLDFNLYKRMIDDFSKLRVDSIIFQGDGEPLLCDKLFEMIRYARNKDIAVSFFTNGLLLDEKTAQEVVKLKITEIYCSLPAGTDKTYALVAHNKDPGAFKKINENLKKLGRLKNQAKELHPRLIMTHVIHTLNYREIMEMAENDVEIGANVIRFYLIRLDDNNRSLQLKPKEAQFIKESLSKVKDYLKNKNVEILDTTDFQLNHYEENTGAWSKNVFLQEGCFAGWFFCLIPALGDISFCCHLRTVGYLAENSFKQIWNSREYEKYRFQAKYLKDNKTAEFINGAKLYDEHCEHCDTHQVLRDIREELKMYNLEKFI